MDSSCKKQLHPQRTLFLKWRHLTWMDALLRFHTKKSKKEALAQPKQPEKGAQESKKACPSCPDKRKELSKLA